MKKILFIFSALRFLSLNAQWQELPAPTTVKGFSISSIAIGNKNFIWALGTKGPQDTTLFRWDAAKKAWQELEKNLPHVEAIAASDNNILFVLQKIQDTASLQAWNGTSWQEMYRIEHARIGSLAAIDHNKVYAIVNEKTYALNGESWYQLGSLEGFREVASGGTNTLLARRFNFESALNPTTAFPAHSLELMRWDFLNKSWQKQEIAIPEKEKGIMSTAVQNDTTVWLIIRESTTGGKAYTWNLEQKKLEQQGTQSDLYLIATGKDGTIWALSGTPEQGNRKLYFWAEKQEVPSSPPAKTALGSKSLITTQPSKVVDAKKESIIKKL